MTPPRRASAGTLSPASPSPMYIPPAPPVDVLPVVLGAMQLCRNFSFFPFFRVFPPPCR